jgi:hypothetical protein
MEQPLRALHSAIAVAADKVINCRATAQFAAMLQDGQVVTGKVTSRAGLMNY